MKRHPNSVTPPNMPTQQQQSGDQLQRLTVGGAPVQAMNVSNHVNVPPGPPHQVINIQPP